MTHPLLRSLSSALPPLLLLLAPATFAQDAGTPAVAAAPDKTQKLLEQIDERSRTFGDYRAVVQAEVKRASGKSRRQLQLYRRDTENKLVLLITAPKTEAGKGYLNAEENLWFYDATIGRWERRTAREAVGGTDGRPDDFDQTHWAKNFNATAAGQEKLGAVQTELIDLRAKDGAQVAYTQVKLWVDAKNGNVLKQQDFSENGKLLRTVLSPKWKKVHSPSKKGDFYYAEQTVIYDELEKENSTRFTVSQIDLRPLQPSVFTKGWLEARSR